MSDLIEFADWVRSTELPEEYDDRQMYQDFRAVLVDGNATPQQARRTLATLCYWGGMWAPTLVAPLDPLAITARAATQDLCKQIIETITKPPSFEPVTEIEGESWEDNNGN